LRRRRLKIFAEEILGPNQWIGNSAILNHMPKNSKSAEEAAADMIQIVRTYLN
jgi:hypothetical protein